MQDLVSTLTLLGVLQGAVLAPVLWMRRANRLANRILAVLVALVALMLLLGDLEHRWGLSHPHMLGLGTSLPFLFGPLLYLYVVALTRPVLVFDPRWIAHSLCFLADVVYMTQVFYVKSGEEKLALARASAAGNVPLSFHLMALLEVVSALVYLFFAWRALGRYGKKMHGYFSDLTKIDLRWLKTLVAAHLAIWSIVFASITLRWMRIDAGPLGIAIEVGSSMAIFLTGYVSLWQPELVEKATAAKVADEELTPIPIEEPEPEPAPVSAPEPPPPAPKYQRNRLDDEEAKELVGKLETLMKEKELFKDGSLTLPTLADALGITPHMLSQVLNVRVGKSFFQFVNGYRADALEKELTDPSKADRTVLELAHQVGFNSKSTLNSFFKKHTGMTPTELRARAQVEKRTEVSSG